MIIIYWSREFKYPKNESCAVSLHSTETISIDCFTGEAAQEASEKHLLRNPVFTKIKSHWPAMLLNSPQSESTDIIITSLVRQNNIAWCRL